MGLSHTHHSPCIRLLLLLFIILWTSKSAFKSMKPGYTHKSLQAASSLTLSQGQVRIENLSVWEQAKSELSWGPVETVRWSLTVKGRPWSTLMLPEHSLHSCKQLPGISETCPQTLHLVIAIQSSMRASSPKKDQGFTHHSWSFQIKLEERQP